MSQPDKQMLTVRLLPRQYRDLRAVAKRHGQTLQGFAESLVLRAIAEEEERRSIPAEPDERSFGRQTKSSEPSSLLVEALREQRIKKADEDAHSKQGQVVVNVGNNHSNDGYGPRNEIDRMATYVAKAGNPLERDTRMRAAVAMLRETASSDEERKVLAARLDEAVASKLKTPALTTEDESGVVRTARVTFDKLSAFWKGV